MGKRLVRAVEVIFYQPSRQIGDTEDISKMLAKDGDSDSAPRGIRTHDPRFRRPVLLSAEL